MLLIINSDIMLCYLKWRLRHYIHRKDNVMRNSPIMSAITKSPFLLFMLEIKVFRIVKVLKGHPFYFWFVVLVVEQINWLGTLCFSVKGTALPLLHSLLPALLHSEVG